MKTCCLLVCGLMLGALHAPVALAELRAGASRVDITPEATKLPRGYEGINDRIFIRAIVVDDGRTRAGTCGHR
jgi:neutral ceramidase